MQQHHQPHAKAGVQSASQYQPTSSTSLPTFHQLQPSYTAPTQEGPLPDKAAFSGSNPSPNHATFLTSPTADSIEMVHDAFYFGAPSMTREDTQQDQLSFLRTVESFRRYVPHAESAMRHRMRNFASLPSRHQLILQEAMQLLYRDFPSVANHSLELPATVANASSPPSVVSPPVAIGNPSSAAVGSTRVLRAVPVGGFAPPIPVDVTTTTTTSSSNNTSSGRTDSSCGGLPSLPFLRSSKVAVPLPVDCSTDNADIGLVASPAGTELQQNTTSSSSGKTANNTTTSIHYKDPTPSVKSFSGVSEGARAHTPSAAVGLQQQEGGGRGVPIPLRPAINLQTVVFDRYQEGIHANGRFLDAMCISAASLFQTYWPSSPMPPYLIHLQRTLGVPEDEIIGLSDAEDEDEMDEDREGSAYAEEEHIFVPPPPAHRTSEIDSNLRCSRDAAFNDGGVGCGVLPPWEEEVSTPSEAPGGIAQPPSDEIFPVALLRSNELISVSRAQAGMSQGGMFVSPNLFVPPSTSSDPLLQGRSPELGSIQHGGGGSNCGKKRERENAITTAGRTNISGGGGAQSNSEARQTSSSSRPDSHSPISTIPLLHDNNSSNNSVKNTNWLDSNSSGRSGNNTSNILHNVTSGDITNGGAGTTRATSTSADTPLNSTPQHPSNPITTSSSSSRGRSLHELSNAGSEWVSSNTPAVRTDNERSAPTNNTSTHHNNTSMAVNPGHQSTYFLSPLAYNLTTSSLSATTHDTTSSSMVGIESPCVGPSTAHHHTRVNINDGGPEHQLLPAGRTLGRETGISSGSESSATALSVRFASGGATQIGGSSPEAMYPLIASGVLPLLGGSTIDVPAFRAAMAAIAEDALNPHMPDEAYASLQKRPSASAESENNEYSHNPPPAPPSDLQASILSHSIKIEVGEEDGEGSRYHGRKGETTHTVVHAHHPPTQHSFTASAATSTSPLELTSTYTHHAANDHNKKDTEIPKAVAAASPSLSAEDNDLSPTATGQQHHIQRRFHPSPLTQIEDMEATSASINNATTATTTGSSGGTESFSNSLRGHNGVAGVFGGALSTPSSSSQRAHIGSMPTTSPPRTSVSNETTFSSSLANFGGANGGHSNNAGGSRNGGGGASGSLSVEATTPDAGSVSAGGRDRRDSNGGLFNFESYVTSRSNTGVDPHSFFSTIPSHNSNPPSFTDPNAPINQGPEIAGGESQTTAEEESPYRPRFVQNVPSSRHSAETITYTPSHRRRSNTDDHHRPTRSNASNSSTTAASSSPRQVFGGGVDFRDRVSYSDAPPMPSAATAAASPSHSPSMWGEDEDGAIPIALGGTGASRHSKTHSALLSTTSTMNEVPPTSSSFGAVQAVEGTSNPPPMSGRQPPPSYPQASTATSSRPGRPHGPRKPSRLPSGFVHPTPTQTDVDKAFSTVRQFVRDWSHEGAVERAAIYGPIINALCALFPNRVARGDSYILVPGAGLSRLSVELAACGFNAISNEFSYHMLLAGDFAMNHLDRPNMFATCPYVDNTINLQQREHQLRTVSVPDVSTYSLKEAVEAAGNDFGSLSMVAGDFVEVFSKPVDANRWDAVASCFFLDTARNILEYLEVLHFLLRPGGYVVNLGPLLFHFADMASEQSIELSLEELLHCAAVVGFRLVPLRSSTPGSVFPETGSSPSSTLTSHSPVELGGTKGSSSHSPRGRTVQQPTAVGEDAPLACSYNTSPVVSASPIPIDGAPDVYSRGAASVPPPPIGDCDDGLPGSSDIQNTTTHHQHPPQHQPASTPGEPAEYVRMIQCSYTNNPTSMKQLVYNAAFFVLQKIPLMATASDAEGEPPTAGATYSQQPSQGRQFSSAATGTTTF